MKKLQDRFKNSAFFRFFKRKEGYSVIVLALLLLLLIGATYAYVTIVVSGTKNNLLTSGILRLSLSEANEIKLTDVVPITSEEGIKTTPFEFTLESTGTKEGYYTIYLIDGELSEGASRLDDKYVNYYLTKSLDGTNTEDMNLVSNLDSKLIMISGIQTSAHVIDTGLINPGDKIDYHPVRPKRLRSRFQDRWNPHLPS